MLCSSSIRNSKHKRRVKKAFPLGRVTVTRSASRKLSAFDIRRALKKHSQREWGMENELRRLANDIFLKSGKTVLSVHLIKDTKLRFFVLTNGVRKETVVMLEKENFPF